MNRRDEFEQRLSEQAFRPMPAAWREEILRSARVHSSPQTSPPAVRRMAVPRPGRRVILLISKLRPLLWPHPRAWAGLAAVWLVIFGLHLADREPARPGSPEQAISPSPELRQMLQEQEHLLAELMGPLEIPDADQPKPAAPRPRSQRARDFSYA